MSYTASPTPITTQPPPTLNHPGAIRALIHQGFDPDLAARMVRVRATVQRETT